MKSIKYYLLVFLLLLAGCTQQKKEQSFEPVSQNKFLLGTVVTVTLYDNPKDEIFAEIFEKIEKIEQEMTINNATTSEVMEINKYAGSKEVKVSEDTFNVIKAGLNYSSLANGKFDSFEEYEKQSIILRDFKMNDEIIIDTTDFSKVNFESIMKQIKERITGE